MSDSTQTPPADQVTTTTTTATTQDPPAAKTYDEAFVAKLQADHAAAAKKAADLEAKVRSDEEKKLKDANNWEQFAKLKEEEAVAAKAESAKFKQAIVERERITAIREEAMKAGIRKEAIADLNLIDFTELKIETGSDGKVSVTGADKAITRLKALRPYWFGSGTPNVNPNTPSATSSSNTVTWEQLKEAEAKAKKTGSADDQAAYRDTLIKFGQQGK
jgi:hypothetical protein